MQVSAGTSGLKGSDAAGSVVEVKSDFESDSDVDRATMQHPVLLPDEDSDAANEVCSVASSANRIKTENIAAGRLTFDAASQPSTGNADSVEIPETPSVAEKMRCPVHPSVVRVIGKWSDAERPRYLVLCWLYSQEGGAVNPDLDSRFRE